MTASIITGALLAASLDMWRHHHSPLGVALFAVVVGMAIRIQARNH